MLLTFEFPLPSYYIDNNQALVTNIITFKIQCNDLFKWHVATRLQAQVKLPFQLFPKKMNNFLIFKS